MSSVSVLVGASVVTFLLVLLFWKLGAGSQGDNGERKGSNHVLLQILLLGFILSGLVVIGKASWDDAGKDCDWLVNQTTVTGNTTNYNYAYNCHVSDTNTGSTFYRLTVWIMRLVGIYIFCYLVYVVLVYFGYIQDKKGRDDLQ